MPSHALEISLFFFPAGPSIEKFAFYLAAYPRLLNSANVSVQQYTLFSCQIRHLSAKLGTGIKGLKFAKI